ncbi:DUF1853 family protein [Agarivorans sp. QJM3NY_25]|uniref:DUF1853 family protein n=1 Tax=Agarivorans sp. QJM3NY_25 TaxID=3421430 RepID=UPI003D7D3C64
MDSNSLQEDLQWCLNARPLLPYSLPYSVNLAWQQQWKSALFKQLNRLPSIKPHPRLGLYFEQLWRALIKRHPDWQLLADNIPVQENGKTLGAIDFLLVNHRQQKVEHWELALKFYLAVKSNSSAYDYVGPNLQDRLSNKLSKLLLKQIPLGRHPQIQALRQVYSHYQFKQRIILSGYLFEQAPEHSETLQSRHWYSHQQWRKNHRGEDWCELNKQQWLSPPAHQLEPIKSTSWQIDRPMQLYCPQQQKRIFVCPDEWFIRAKAS